MLPPHNSQSQSSRPDPPRGPVGYGRHWARRVSPRVLGVGAFGGRGRGKRERTMLSFNMLFLGMGILLAHVRPRIKGMHLDNLV